MNLCLFHPGFGVNEQHKDSQATLHERELSNRNSSTRFYRTKILKAVNGIRFKFLLLKY